MATALLVYYMLAVIFGVAFGIPILRLVLSHTTAVK